MLHIVQNGNFVLENAGFGIYILESGLIYNLNCDWLVAYFTKAAIHLTKLTRTQQVVYIELIIFSNILLNSNKKYYQQQ